VSGHNKWSKIRHKKGAADAKRSKLWTKLIRELTVAVRLGGTDPSANPRLRKASDDARTMNLPRETLQRAIKRGSGDDDAADYEELRYEAYGPGGVAMMIDCTTDNRNRTSADVRSVLRRADSELGKDGSVSFLFTKLGQFVFDKKPDAGKAPTEDALIEIGLEHGADDISDAGESFEVTCSPDDFNGLREAFEGAGFVPALANIEQVPSTTVKIAGDEAATLLKLIDKLEDLDDVQNVWANFDIADDEIERLTA
jgi:YebC/PmpR family DNA-binding regulatory protein